MFSPNRARAEKAQVGGAAYLRYFQRNELNPAGVFLHRAYECAPRCSRNQ